MRKLIKSPAEARRIYGFAVKLALFCTLAVIFSGCAYFRWHEIETQELARVEREHREQVEMSRLLLKPGTTIYTK